MIASASSRIAEGFNTLLARCQLTQRDVDLFTGHRSTATTAVKSRLEVAKVDLIGSFARGTAIHGASDIDLLLVLSRSAVTWGGNLKGSSRVLGDVRDALRERYPGTAIGRDGQAVVVSFNDGGHPLDVVPACYLEHGGSLNYPLYAIPDGQNGWMQTSPGAHNKFIGDADARSGGKLKYVGQAFKVWRDARAGAVPISAFHVELVLANEGHADGARSYSSIFRDLLMVLARRECAALRDPIGVSGLIAASSTESKRQQAARTVIDSARHADAALAAERLGDAREAQRQWEIVFNGRFPR
jgi:predicted nucleotidyltransferase